MASTQASTSKNEGTKVFVPLTRDFELLDVLARKVVLRITPSVGRTPKQQCEDLLPDLWRGVNLRQN